MAARPRIRVRAAGPVEIQVENTRRLKWLSPAQRPVARAAAASKVRHTVAGGAGTPEQ